MRAWKKTSQRKQHLSWTLPGMCGWVGGNSRQKEQQQQRHRSKKAWIRSKQWGVLHDSGIGYITGWTRMIKSESQTNILEGLEYQARMAAWHHQNREIAWSERTGREWGMRGDTSAGCCHNVGGNEQGLSWDSDKQEGRGRIHRTSRLVVRTEPRIYANDVLLLVCGSPASSESLGGLVKIQPVGPSLRISNRVRHGPPETGPASKLPGEADVASLGTILWDPLLQVLCGSSLWL